MTEYEAIKRLSDIYSECAGDDEAIHSREDTLLMEIIEDFGWSDFVTKYDNANHQRWCA